MMDHHLVSKLDSLDYTIVGIYLIGMIAIGFWVSLKVKDFASFFVAGRVMTMPILICTLVSTYYGLDVTFGVSEVSFQEGVMAWFAYSRPYYLAILITGLIIAGRLKAFAFLSLADVAEHFYGTASRIIVALASFLYNLPIISIMGMGILLNVTLGIPEAQGCLIGAVIAVVYTSLGGLWADAMTDTVQFVLMCVTAAIAVPFAVNMVGGFAWLTAHMDAKYFAATGDVSTPYLLALVFTAFSVFVEPAFYQRIFAARDQRSVRRALLVGIFLWAAYDWAATVLGIAAAAAVKQGLLSSDLEGREALVNMVLVSLPIGLKGFFIAGVLSAAMSTVDSYLLLSSGNLVYDIYRPLFNPAMSDHALLRWTRVGIVVALLPCLVIALYFERITDAWVFMSTVLTATALIPLMAGLFLPGKRNSLEGLYSSLFGLVTALSFYATITFLGRPENDSYVLDLMFSSRSLELRREYSLFFALPASIFGFLIGWALSAVKRQPS
jgi:SSS family solute:Na+ symporter